MLSMPRSGAAYYFTGRGLSPIFGVMEGWRSVITNPFFRGTGAFLAIEVFNGGLLVMGLATGDPIIQGMAAALAVVEIKVVVSLISIFIGFIFSYLSVKWLGWFVIIIGIYVIAATVIADLIVLATPIDATVWDATFGGEAGLSYAELQASYPAVTADVDYTTLNLGGVGAALVFTVGMMWPYLIMPVAGEVAQPSKNIPLSNLAGALGIGGIAILGAVALEGSLGTFLYSAGQASAWGGDLWLAGFNAGFGNFAAIALQGNPISWLLVIAPLLASIADSPSNALWVTRPFHAMAMDRFCPEAFASVHPKYHVPHVSLYFWLILTIISVVMTAWFQLGVLLGVAFTYNFIRWQIQLSAVALPYHRPTLWERSGAWKFLGIPLISLAGLIAGAVFFAGMITFAPSATYEVPFTVGVYVVGQLAYMYYGAKNKAKGINMAAIFGQLPPE
jgi:amino acid transporter